MNASTRAQYAVRTSYLHLRRQQFTVFRCKGGAAFSVLLFLFRSVQRHVYLAVTVTEYCRLLFENHGCLVQLLWQWPQQVGVSLALTYFMVVCLSLLFGFPVVTNIHLCHPFSGTPRWRVKTKIHLFSLYVDTIRSQMKATLPSIAMLEWSSINSKWNCDT